MSDEKLEMLNEKIVDENSKNKKLEELNDKINSTITIKYINSYSSFIRSPISSKYTNST